MKKIMTLLLVGGLLFSARASVVTDLTTGQTSSASVTTPVFNDLVVEDALREFKSLTRTERKAKMKAVKKMLREYKAVKKAGCEVSTNQVLLGILCVILPPLAVGLHQGEINGKFWLSLLLTLLFWLPGIIYALIVVFG
ncbi:MAG: YqaE/Pmp3 family membrane protein [Bacteroidota bacterium]